MDNFDFLSFLNLVLLFSVVPSTIIGGVIWLSYLSSRRKALRDEHSASNPKVQRRIDQPQRSYPVWLLLMCGAVAGVFAPIVWLTWAPSYGAQHVPEPPGDYPLWQILGCVVTVAACSIFVSVKLHNTFRGCVLASIAVAAGLAVPMAAVEASEYPDSFIGLGTMVTYIYSAFALFFVNLLVAFVMELKKVRTYGNQVPLIKNGPIHK